jgi:hypothetical protein
MAREAPLEAKASSIILYLCSTVATGCLMMSARLQPRNLIYRFLTSSQSKRVSNVESCRYRWYATGGLQLGLRQSSVTSTVSTVKSSGPRATRLLRNFIGSKSLRVNVLHTVIVRGYSQPLV